MSFARETVDSAQWALWACAPVAREATGVRFLGWALPRHAAGERVSVELDERALHCDPCAAPDQNVFLRFDVRDDLDRRGFSFVLPDDVGVNREAILRCRFGAGVSPRPCHACFLRRVDVPAADVEQMRRTTGMTNAEQFDFLGYTQLRHLEHLLREYFAIRASDLQHVLDWRCGAARVLRFARGRWRAELHGADVDPVNIAWCRARLPEVAQFRQLALDPPMPFESDRFDLVYGISVFTHLGEADQTSWLEELRRVTKPGGAVIVTVHGPTAFAREVADFWKFAELASKGFLDAGASLDLVSGFPESVQSGRYRNVFHTHRYICERWSRFFEIIDIVSGASVGHQDYVIMRRP